MDTVGNGHVDDHIELLAAQSHIWNHLFNFINSMSLKCALQLGIPDIIHQHVDHPITLDQLVHALPISPEKPLFIHRLMRILTHSGFFRKVKINENDDEEKGYALTPSSKLLLKENPLSMTPYLLVALDPLMMNPWHGLSRWYQNSDVTPFVTWHGKTVWELAGQEPRLNRLINEGMASDSRLASTVVIENCKDVFLGLNSLVDVGGGTGTMAQSIADAFPHLKCIVLDLPHVVDGLKISDNLVYVGGDMFKAIPPADAALLKWIMHNWSDSECVEILKKCKEAIPSKEKGGKVIIIDVVMDQEHSQNGDFNANDETKITVETQLFLDLSMMVLVKGKERSEKEWAKLFFEAGFSCYKIHKVLGIRSLIEVYYF